MKKSIFRKICGKFGIKWPVYNVNHTNYKKKCLLLYISYPFFSGVEEGHHQNIWQTKRIAKILGELGYDVDAMDYDTKYVLLRHKYDLVFDISVKDKPVYEKHLNKDAKRIVYFTGSESQFANSAEEKRIADLFERRGVVLQPRRSGDPVSKTVEQFDGALLIGNQYNLRTYAKLDLPKTYLIPNTGYDFGNRIDHTQKKACNFLFFGSMGSVHKGLDLLLEVFSEENFPANLYVCGGYEREKDFIQAYRKELYSLPNIKAFGFVDIWSDQFTQIANECAYTILPSCSEGMAGSITTAMSAGMIPICSRECGFEEDEVITLENCEISTIRSAILACCNRSQDWIESERKRVLALVGEKYSVGAFTEAMTTALKGIIEQ